jgi:hypothetical protein
MGEFQVRLGLRIEERTRLEVSLRNKLTRLFDSDGVVEPLARLVDRYDQADYRYDQAD